jgi:hypothetical protein
MKKYNQNLVASDCSNLFDRVVSILDQARTDSLRAVNNNMVIAYWLIGREIVLEIQGGKERAEYGKQLIEQLSLQLTQKYGRGFSTTNLRYFRTFYTVYADRGPQIRHIASGELDLPEKHHIQSGVLDDMTQAVEKTETSMGFSPYLGWAHYRALMNVEHRNERLFYEIEAEKEGWGVELLERPIRMSGRWTAMSGCMMINTLPKGTIPPSGLFCAQRKTKPLPNIQC